MMATTHYYASDVHGSNRCFRKFLNAAKFYKFSFDLVDPLLDEAATMDYADAIRELAAARGLFMHSTFTGLAAYSWSQLLHPQQAICWYECAIDFTARLGAQGMGGHIGALSVQDAMNPEYKQMLLRELEERLAALSHYAAPRGLSHLLFENMAVERESGLSRATTMRKEWYVTAWTIGARLFESRSREAWRPQESPC